MIRVLYILHTLERAGVEKFVCDLICKNENVIEAQVVCLDKQGALADKLKARGIKIYCTNRKSGIDISQAFKIAKIIRQNKPDIIHAHQYTPFFYSAIAKLLARQGRLIFTEHGRHFPDIVSKKRKFINRLLLLQTSAITAVCQFTKCALIENENISANRIEVIYNGIDTDVQVAPIDKTTLSLNQNFPVIVHVGNFRPVKNQELAIRALKILIDKKNYAYLLFVGSGSDLEKCKALTDTLNLNDYVRFVGQRDDVYSILSIADVMINTSVSEAFSVAILEAMLLGLPVVATNVGGNSELVGDNKTGLLVNPDNPYELAEAIKNILQNQHLRERFGQTGRDIIISKFNIETIHNKYISLYKRIMNL